MRLVVLLVVLWPATALADIGIGIDVDIEVRTPPPPPSPPPPPPLPVVNHGWNMDNRVALALTTTAAMSVATGERGQGMGGALTFHAVGQFPLDMSIETVHERLGDRSHTLINYALHIVDRRRRMQPFMVIPLGVAIVATPDVTVAQGFFGIGGGVRLRASTHWMPSFEMRMIHRNNSDDMGEFPAETVIDARVTVMYLF